MSYNLDGSASNSRVEYVSGVTGSAYPTTISLWFFCTNATVAGSGMSMVSVSNSAKTNYHSVNLLPNSTASNIRVRASTTENGGALANATPTVGSLQNKWTHVAGVFNTPLTTTNTSRWCIVNGRTKGTNGTGRPNVTSIVDMVVGATASTTSANALTGQFQGYLAEVGIWNVSLTDDDIYALSRGAKPTAVQPNYLVHYVPFVQNTNDIVYGQSPKTVQGATPLAVHPTRYG